MVLCSRPECQTTAGCKCNQRSVYGLDSFSDEEIAREHHWRMVKKLGDPRICVTVPTLAGQK